MQGKIYHLGFRTSVARSTLADANESRDWRIFADFAQVSKAILQMLQATQEAATKAEESTAAGEKLDAQSETLRNLVNRLTIFVGSGRNDGFVVGGRALSGRSVTLEKEWKFVSSI